MGPEGMQQSKAPVQMCQPCTVFGQVYVSVGDTEIGIGSYHFVSEDEAYISYENDKCKRFFPRLDTRGRPDAGLGERLPRRMAFRDASYDPIKHTFKGTVSFSCDLGTYENVRTVDGVEQEEYEMVFSDDLEEIVGGQCGSFYPNASKSHRCDRFGIELRYVRWRQSEIAEAQLQNRCSMHETFMNINSLPSRIRDVDARTKEAGAAVFAMDANRLRRAFEEGAPVEVEVDPVELWKRMRWDPGQAWRDASVPHASLLIASMLLEWPEGVELCVRQGADVNATYSGPFRLAAGGVGGRLPIEPGIGQPILRLALSSRSQSQCLICRYILDGLVDLKVFQRLKKKEQDEMEFDTKELFRHWMGSFLRQCGH